MFYRQFLCVTVLMVVCSRAEAQSCQPSWSDQFGYGPVSGQVNTSVVFDDGRGPALYVGGAFQYAGSLQVRNIARWSNGAWEALQTPGRLPGVNGAVHALKVFDDGRGPALYVGGVFSEAGGQVATYIAKWDGMRWSGLDAVSTAGRIGEYITDLGVYNDGTGAVLYATGHFAIAGSAAARNIAKWDGAAWSPLGTGLELVGPGFGGAIGTSLASYTDATGSRLYVVGQFDRAGGVVVSSLARWDGSQWSEIGGFSPGAVVGPPPEGPRLAVHNDGSGAALFVGPVFGQIGGVAAPGIARWNGIAWSGTGLTTGATALTVTRLNGADRLVSARQGRLGVWDGVQWNLIGPTLSAPIWTLAGLEDSGGASFFAGGLFTSDGVDQLPYLAKLEENRWEAVAPVGFGLSRSPESLIRLETPTGPRLLVNSSINTPGLTGLIGWTANGWTEFSANAPGSVDTLAYFEGGGGGLFAGGRFTFLPSGGIANRIARWDGTEWHAVEPLFQSGGGLSVRRLIRHDDGGGPELFAGGRFTVRDGNFFRNNIAKWNGTRWLSIGGGSDAGGEVFGMEVFDAGDGPEMYIAGSFRTLGTVQVGSGFAKWNGTGWVAIPIPAGYAAFSPVELVAASFHGRRLLLLAGDFRRADTGQSAPVMAWDGTSLAPIGDFGMGTGSSRVRVFSTSQGQSIRVVQGNSLRTFDGTSWRTEAGLFSSSVSTIEVFDDGDGPALFAAGNFDTVAGVASSKFARLGSCLASCVADSNNDGGVTIEDLLDYIAAFGDGLPRADVDDGSRSGTRDGGVTVEDLLHFLDRFGAGC